MEDRVNWATDMDTADVMFLCCVVLETVGG